MKIKIERRELFNSCTHLIGAIGAVFITILYVRTALPYDPLLAMAVAVTGISYATLFTASFLHHAHKLNEKEENIWIKLDHSAIFIMMAGSYVGPMYIFAAGGLLYGVLIAVWIFAVAGIIIKMRFVTAPNWVNLVSYAPLGAISLIPIIILWGDVNSIPAEIVPLYWLRVILLAGLAIYAAGGIVYAVKRPDPEPELIGFHGIFHVMVLSGAFLHSIALYYSIKWYPLIQQQMKIYQ